MFRRMIVPKLPNKRITGINTLHIPFAIFVCFVYFVCFVLCFSLSVESFQIAIYPE